MEDDMLGKPPVNTRLATLVAVVVSTAVLAGWYYWHSRTQQPTQLPAVQKIATPSLQSPEHSLLPVPPADTLESLPDLNSSDKSIADALDAAAGQTPLMQYLLPENIVRRIVVTVDNVPRQKLAADKRPVATVSGAFMADGDELHATLDMQNFRRYQPMVEMLRKLDMQRLAAVYLHFYPLFQKAYQDLGYPDGYFNDRLVKAIDVLLATPQVEFPIDMVRPNVMFRFADPALEALPAGQKVLIRMGPENATAVKSKLVELRTFIAAAPLTR